MKVWNRRAGTIMVFLAFITIASGTITVVYASPTCQKALHSIVRKVVPNKVSKRVAERWAEWGRKHPNWHPKVGAKPRPKTKTILISSVIYHDVACELETEDIPVPLDFPPIQTVFDITPFVITPTPYTLPPDIDITSANEGEDDDDYSPPSAYPPIFTGGGGIEYPVYPKKRHHRHRHPSMPITPPPTSPVPEPSSIILTATGILLLRNIKKATN